MSAYDDAILALSPSSYYPSSDGVDAGANGWDMTLVNSPVAVNSIVPSEDGAANGALQFDNSNWAHIGDHYAFQDNWSICYWFRPEQTGSFSGFRRLFEKRDTVAPNVGILGFFYPDGIDNQTMYFSLEHDLGASVEGQTVVPNLRCGSVYFITHVWDDTASDPSLMMYYNGRSLGPANNYNANMSAAWAGDFTIGAPSGGGPDNTTRTIGTIGKFAIWDGVKLTAAQIATLWATGFNKYRISPPIYC